MNELHLFAGAGGGILGGMLLGHTCVCAVEIEPYPRKVLLQRQRDGILPNFPIWDDIRTFDGTPWRGRVDIVCGGFPCQDISSAGKGAGITGVRSGLWGEMARVIREVRPRFVFVENSPALTFRGLGTVLGDLAEMGYDAEWDCFSAREIGAPHERERIWILATNTNVPQCEGGRVSSGVYQKHPDFRSETWRPPSPALHRVDDGVAYGLDRLRAIGNGQVPIVAALAWEALRGKRLTSKKSFPTPVKDFGLFSPCV